MSMIDCRKCEEEIKRMELKLKDELLNVILDIIAIVNRGFILSSKRCEEITRRGEALAIELQSEDICREFKKITKEAIDNVLTEDNQSERVKMFYKIKDDLMSYNKMKGDK